MFFGKVIFLPFLRIAIVAIEETTMIAVRIIGALSMTLPFFLVIVPVSGVILEVFGTSMSIFSITKLLPFFVIIPSEVPSS